MDIHGFSEPIGGKTEQEWAELVQMSGYMLNMPYQVNVPESKYDWYCYFHVDPATQWIMYVGMGRRERAYQFRRRTRFHAEAIACLKARYTPEQIVRVFPQPNRDAARYWEVWAIDRCLQEGHILYNKAMTRAQHWMLSRIYQTALNTSSR